MGRVRVYRTASLGLQANFGGGRSIGSIKVRPLGVGDADAVAALRGDAVREGMLAEFGHAGRRAFFRAAASDRDTFGFVAEDDDGILGFALVTQSATRIERAVLIRNPPLWVRGIRILLRSSALLGRAMPHVGGLISTGGASAKGDEPTLRLLDIVVANRARRRGLGRALLAATLQETWNRGYDAIGLSVLTENLGAVQLYESAGFRVSSSGVRSDRKPFLTMRLDQTSGQQDQEAARPAETKRPQPVAH